MLLTLFTAPALTCKAASGVNTSGADIHLSVQTITAAAQAADIIALCVYPTKLVKYWHRRARQPFCYPFYPFWHLWLHWTTRLSAWRTSRCIPRSEEHTSELQSRGH